MHRSAAAGAGLPGAPIPSALAGQADGSGGSGVSGRSGAASAERDAADASLAPAQAPKTAINSLGQDAVQTALSATPAQGPVGSPGTSAAAPTAPTTLTLAEPVTSPLFAGALGAQLSLLAKDGVQTALLQLNPAEMGPITVQIALNGTAATVEFEATRADTRDVIEASLPALAGAMQAAGLTLAGGGVFEHGQGRQQAPAEPRTPDKMGSVTQRGTGAAATVGGASGPGGPNDPDGPDGPGGATARRSAPRGLVDLVA